MTHGVMGGCVCVREKSGMISVVRYFIDEVLNLVKEGYVRQCPTTMFGLGTKLNI